MYQKKKKSVQCTILTCTCTCIKKHLITLLLITLGSLGCFLLRMMRFFWYVFGYVVSTPKKHYSLVFSCFRIFRTFAYHSSPTFCMVCLQICIHEPEKEHVQGIFFVRRLSSFRSVDKVKTAKVKLSLRKWYYRVKESVWSNLFNDNTRCSAFFIAYSHSTDFLPRRG
jgi:hypothetical protein